MRRPSSAFELLISSLQKSIPSEYGSSTPRNRSPQCKRTSRLKSKLSRSISKDERAHHGAEHAEHTAVSVAATDIEATLGGARDRSPRARLAVGRPGRRRQDQSRVDVCEPPARRLRHDSTGL